MHGPTRGSQQVNGKCQVQVCSSVGSNLKHKTIICRTREANSQSMGSDCHRGTWHFLILWRDQDSPAHVRGMYAGAGDVVACNPLSWRSGRSLKNLGELLKQVGHATMKHNALAKVQARNTGFCSWDLGVAEREQAWRTVAIHLARSVTGSLYQEIGSDLQDLHQCLWRNMSRDQQTGRGRC